MNTLRDKSEKKEEKFTYLQGEVLNGCSDTQLWNEFRSGNKQAFDIIYDRFFQMLCIYGDRFCKDTTLVEDVVQDLFIYLWNKRENLGRVNIIKPYLLLSLRRKLLRVLASEQKRTCNISVLESEKDSYAFHLSLKRRTSTAEEEEIFLRLSKALSRLTDRQKEAIYLKFYNNLSFQEVASIMDIEVRSLYNLMSRTLDILRNDLDHKEAPTIIMCSLLVTFLTYCSQ
jgi:RNA polymerase sigma-70 factor (ECF subfamily)